VLASKKKGIVVYSPAMTEIYCIITGLVQNVNYRDYVQVSASELKLTGSVRNLPDGTVEVIAQGTPDQLKDFVEYLHEGSLQAKVEAVSVEWRTARKVAEDFSIIF
jgi:acylphosphatase